MGKRKSRKKAPAKRKLTGDIPTVFNCPFCNHEESCSVIMDVKRHVGMVSCSICFEKFNTPITYLDLPIDVYNAWIDACEELN